MLLALLLSVQPACQRDDLAPAGQLPPSTLSPEQAKSQFRQTYQPGQDEFKDQVMRGIMQLNDSLPIVQSLATRYGVPRWDMDRITPETKGDQLLLLPLQGNHADSLGLMVFINTDKNNIKYKVFEPTTADTIALDLMLFYRMQLYPKGDYSQRWVVHDKEPSKDVEIITHCLWVYERDKYSFEELKYYICRTKIIGCLNNTTDNQGSDNTSDPWADLPGGDPPSTRKPVEKINPTLVKLIKMLEDKHCPNQTVISRVWNRVNFFTDRAIGGNGGYDPDSGDIYFSSISGLTASTLIHELFHAYQHALMGSNYPGKGEPGYVNMEFEAWLYTDLWASGRGTEHESWINNTGILSLSREYNEWLKKIGNNPAELNNSSEYMKWLGVFHEVMTEYRSPIDFVRDKVPNQMINAFKNCKPIN